MNIHDDLFEEDLVYLEDEGAEFGMPAIDPADDVDALTIRDADDEVIARLVQEEGGVLLPEDGGTDDCC